MSLTKVSHSMINGAAVNVLDYGADPTGVTDSTAAIQAAVNARNGFVAIYFPAGTYKITDTITFAYSRYLVYGDGVASRINFVPTTNADCFVFDTGSVTSDQNTIRDLAFYSDDTTYDKRAIVLVDVSDSLLENIHTIYPHWSGGGNYSTFLRIKGRETTSIRKLTVFADQPIDIYPIPAPHVAAGIGIDHFHFQDCYFGCLKATRSIVEIANGVDLTHVTFDGYQAWVGGNYGVYWNNTTATGVSLAFTVKNVRWESQTGTTGYFVYVNHNFGVQQVNLENLYGASSTNGFYFNNVTNINLKQILYLGSQTALSVDAASDFITFDNVHFNNVSATVSIPSQGHSGTYWLGGNAVSYLPDSPSGGVAQLFNAEPNNGYTRFFPKQFTVSNGSVVLLCASNTYSTLIVNAASASVSAIYQIKGANNGTVLMVSSDAAWFGSSVGDKKINIYWDGSKYALQNISGGDIVFNIVAIG